MSRSDRFEPIKDIADGKERDAGTSVALAQQALQDREQQLDEQSASQRLSREIANETGTWKIGRSGRWKAKDEK